MRKKGLKKWTDESFTFDNALQDFITTGTTWIRKEDIQPYNKEWCVFEKPRITDFCQGVIGNCWFISAFALLVEHPNLLNDIILESDTTLGCYTLRLFINGNWKLVTVDDYFVCSRYTKELVFAESNKQLWAPLIEKALAKLNDNYINLESGTSIEGFTCNLIYTKLCVNVTIYLDVKLRC